MYTNQLKKNDSSNDLKKNKNNQKRCSHCGYKGELNIYGNYGSIYVEICTSECLRNFIESQR